MTILVALGGVSPAEYGEMDYHDSVELARRLLKRQKGRDEFTIELVKVLVEACGARIA